MSIAGFFTIYKVIFCVQFDDIFLAFSLCKSCKWSQRNHGKSSRVFPRNICSKPKWKSEKNLWKIRKIHLQMWEFRSFFLFSPFSVYRWIFPFLFVWVTFWQDPLHEWWSSLKFKWHQPRFFCPRSRPNTSSIHSSKKATKRPPFEKTVGK